MENQEANEDFILFIFGLLVTFAIEEALGVFLQ